ncbi:MAG: radical SAM protein [Pseudomonadota bacterium]
MNIIIKTTKRCNLRCKYCYEHAHHNRDDVFTVKKIERLFNRIRDFYLKDSNPSKLLFVWHGGEPMLMPVSFYWRVLELQDQIFCDKKFNIINGIQTNLTLLDEDYLELFKTGRMGTVGVSFDAINVNRVFRNGAPTEAAVLKNLDILNEHGIRCSMLCVITRQNIGRAEEIYRFFRERNLSFSTVPSHHLGPRKENLYGITPTEYARFSMKLFDLWFYDRDADIIITNFGCFIAALAGAKDGLGDCAFSKSCPEHTIHFNPDGTAYNCSRMDFGRYIYGNIFSQSMDEIMESPARKMLLGRYDIVKEECAGCRYFEKCYGGCPNLGRGRGNFLHKSTMCPYFKAMFSHIEKRLKQHDLLTRDGHLRKNYAKRLEAVSPPDDMCWQK